jgi:hypothetical protein
MSLVFNDTSNLTGIVQAIYRNTGADAIKYPIKEVTADVNLAIDNFLAIALTASGKWNIDDSNQTDYPIITTNLISGQRDYSFTTDEQGNLILDIYKVMIKDANGRWNELMKVDQQSPNSPDNPVAQMLDGQDVEGTPDRYDKTANGIFLDPIPNYSASASLKVWINREASYFTSTDTTKKPGFPGILHEYFVVRPTAYYAQRKRLDNANFWANELLKWEGDESRGFRGKIKKYYSQRSKDEMLVMTPQSINPF